MQEFEEKKKIVYIAVWSD